MITFKIFREILETIIQIKVINLLESVFLVLKLKLKVAWQKTWNFRIMITAFSQWKFLKVGKSELALPITHTILFLVYNPNNTDYKIFFNMKNWRIYENPKNENFLPKDYLSAQMAKLPAIEPQTTKAFYKVSLTLII